MHVRIYHPTYGLEAQIPISTMAVSERYEATALAKAIYTRVEWKSHLPDYAIIVLFEGNSMSDGHKVFCVKLQKELAGLNEPPFDTELGKKIYDNVSRDAWNMWMEHCKMLLNEYRLNPARKEDQQVIVQHLEQYFFGEGSALPKEYVPPSRS
jgi:Fe-S cluster biosynthesis and repair protein YggX